MPARALATAPLPRAADLVIVGGGIVGAASAFYAARAGLGRILVVERRPALASLTTTRSLEGVRAQFEHPDDVAMMRESLEVFEHFGEALGLPGYDVSFHRQGYLFLSQAPDGPDRIAGRVALQRAAGLGDVEALSGEEARRRFPFLAADVTAAAFRQRDGWIASHEASYGFARASGASFALETELTGFELAGGRLRALHTSRGTVSAPQAVIAAGPYAPRLARLAGVALPLVLLRRHRAGVKNDPRIPPGAPMSVSLETGAHFRPEGPGAYLGWSGALEERPDEPREVVPVDWSFPALALDACARFAPFWAEVAAKLARANVTLEAGQYTVSPDAKPLIGPLPGIGGLFVNAGYSGHGVMGSPGGARRLAQALTGELTPEANAFDPARFARGAVAGRQPL